MSIYWTLSDIAAMTRRNLIRYVRIPTLIAFSTVQPVMFVLLFAYVFGGAIRTPGAKYIDYLMPGIMIQVVVFGSTATGVGLAEDLSKGMIDRFRSLPMARSAVLAGRTLADTTRNVFVVLLMTGVGTLIGFRFHAGFLRAVAALGLAVLVGFAFCWISATIGMAVGDAETAQVGGFIWLFPLIFASSIFVPVETMPSWLQTVAGINPITSAVNAARALALGGPVQEPLIKILAWVAGILLVFCTLSIRKYRRV
ncbi:MAG: ABC transporter permease [Actinomycetota bacterium]